MQFAKLVAAMAAIALGSTQALAADKPADPKDKVVKPVTSTSKPTDKGAQGGIILQNQGGRAADKGAQGGIILQNQGGKPADKGAQGGIILQNQGAKAPATAKTATQKKTTGGTQ
jgi:ribosomal protein S20